MIKQERFSRSELQLLITRILEKTSFETNPPLPVITVSRFDKEHLTLSFFLLSQDQVGLGPFFYEMVTRSLPGRVSLFFLAPIEDHLVVAELELVFQSIDEWKGIRGQIEILREKLLVGMRSPYHARRVLELKGMSIEEKRIRMQERVAKTIHRFPKVFDYDFFSLVQHYFARVNQEHFRFHNLEEIHKNLSGLYLLKKKIIFSMEKEPNRRHLFVRVKKKYLHLPLGSREVLGVSLGLNFLSEYELFTEKHFLKAIQSLIPNVASFNESVYSYEDPEYPLRLLYVEIDSQKGEEIKRELPLILKGKVERLQHPLFMPRNEEEVMRHIVTLAGELKFSRDLPQVVLSFREQIDEKFYFTVIIARVLLPNHITAEEILKKLKHLNPCMERVKKIGMLRKRHFKEVIVLTVELPLIDFLRDDQSVDLYKARLFVLKELEAVVGEVRDYNGGMISQQNEVLTALQELLGEEGIKYQLLLDNFFHSLFPIEGRSLIDPKHLQVLFLLLLEGLKQKEAILIRQKEDDCYFLIETSEKERLLQLFERANFSLKPASLQISVDERFFFGFIAKEQEEEQIISIMRNWKTDSKTQVS